MKKSTFLGINRLVVSLHIPQIHCSKKKPPRLPPSEVFWRYYLPKEKNHIFHKVNSPRINRYQETSVPSYSREKKKKKNCKQQLQYLEHREAGKQMRVFKSTGGIPNSEPMGHISSMVGENSAAECMFRDYLFWR